MNTSIISSFLALMILLFKPCYAKKSLYTIKVNDIQGNPVNMEDFKGKVLLIVNTASNCGYTDTHMKALNRLHKILVGDGKSFEILTFPCNDFGGQEPLKPKQIEAFARDEYQCQFPVMEKVTIIQNPHPIWKFIMDSSGVIPTWNFHKYLFDSQGNFVNAWGAQVPVQSIVDQIRAIVDRTESENARNKPEL